ncbi:hypothetical protein BO78DRAFT_422852 [Aspergillus sclerotiicarbonarius CBS 121057]|uniref:Uncharacterized protein n=1 Tax=Aspergillus sclerotiicarbonarius (strain CBS 121057 / IBT 28362) TaxID=1448318 RepID=A0A319DWH2_ASPSB|nr:hypothetical protein BO78DRAFT_422852 [Aspergillus sclerotiicarbonarius CBS 121057]
MSEDKTSITMDPETMPFPSFDLLQMQWVLNRIAALAGAADITDEEFEPDFESFEVSATSPRVPPNVGIHRTNMYIGVSTHEKYMKRDIVTYILS